MIKPAFSTVACPEWTLDRVAARAREMGFEAVELRASWEPGKQFASDPLLTSADKARALFQSAGAEVLSLATGLRFDEPVMPPVLGHVFGDLDKTIRWGKYAIDLAVGLECPLVRVFGFQGPSGEKRSRLLRRVADRVRLVCDHANKTGVKVVIENGGSFATAEQLGELIESVNSPLLGACYSLSAARLAGEDPGAGVKRLGRKVWSARVKDADAAGKPCALGQGTLDVPAFISALLASGFDGPIIFEWDRAWNPDLAAADEVLPAAAKFLFEAAVRGGVSRGGAGGGAGGSPAGAARR